MKKLNQPTSQLEEVLYFLITRLKINRKDMIITANVYNLADCIFRLRKKGIPIKNTYSERMNSFKRMTSYCEYSIENKKKAAKVYQQLQLDNINHRKARGND